MDEQGNLQIGEIKKKKESLNQTGGINTEKSIFQTESQSPYASRVESLANNGPIMQNRFHVTNSNDLMRPGFKRTPAPSAAPVNAGETHTEKVRSEEKQDIIKAQSDLKVFSGDVMKKGAFTPKAKEASRHFLEQVSRWAGSFNDGGSGFYSNLGIESVLDCLYVDGMSLRNYVKEQYFYKTSGDQTPDKESLRNYLALLAARGDHVITMVRPSLKGDSAEVEYRNLDVDLTNVGSEQASHSKKLKEKGKQIRSDLKKRMDPDITESTGRAFRKAKGLNMDGFNRLESASDGLKEVSGEKTEEYKAFDKSFRHYSSGLQKLGLKPGRDDINSAVAKKLKERCSEAIEAADSFLRSGSKDKAAVKAVENAKKMLETDLELLEKAINDKLYDENRTMSLEEMLDSNPDKPEGGNPDGKADGEASPPDDPGPADGE